MGGSAAPDGLHGSPPRLSLRVDSGRGVQGAVQSPYPEVPGNVRTRLEDFRFFIYFVSISFIPKYLKV